MDVEVAKSAQPKREERTEVLVRIALAIVVVLYLALGIGYNLKVPKWNAPDEPAHFNYVRQLAEGQGLPVLTPGDWNLEYQSKLIDARFPDNLSIDPIRYENWQPPLYYALAAPIYAVTDGHERTQVFALRFFSTILGALLLLVLFATAREIFPRQRWLPLMACTLVALVPMYGAINASITNDALANLILSVIIWLVVVIANPLRREPTQRHGITGWLTSVWWHGPLALGIVMGLGFITKSTTYIGVGLIVVGALFAPSWVTPWATNWLWHKRWREILRSLVVSGIIALALGGWWFVRNAMVYGQLDIMGSRNHSLVVVGQTKTEIFDWAVFSNLLQTSYRSFWAQFGWMGIPADQRTFDIVTVVCGLIVLGLLVFVVRALVRRADLSAYQWHMLVVMALTVVAAFGVFMIYNLEFLQPQGRYLFPAMVAFGILGSFGLSQLVPRRFVPILYVAIAAVLLFVDVWCLFRVVANAFGT